MKTGFRRVSYLIGTFLCFPLYYFHIIPEPEEKKEKKKPTKYYPEEKFSQTGSRYQAGSKNATQVDTRRTCGQAQKSVRVKYSAIPPQKRK